MPATRAALDPHHQPPLTSPPAALCLQKHRGGGNWDGKVFSYDSTDEEVGSAASSSIAADGSTPASSGSASSEVASSSGSESVGDDALPLQRLQTTQW